MTADGDIFIEGPGYRVTRRDVDVQTVRSSGPGGQNVNKVATKVVLHFNVSRAEGLSEYVRQRLLSLFANQITREGDLVIASDRYRSQHQNLEDALSRLAARLKEASARVRPRRRTRIPAGVREARLRAKKHRSRIKRLRGRPED